jgi:hypothetical protein
LIAVRDYHDSGLSRCFYGRNKRKHTRAM